MGGLLLGVVDIFGGRDAVIRCTHDEELNFSFIETK